MRFSLCPYVCRWLCAWLLVLCAGTSAGAQLWHHDLQVSLFPAEGRLQVQDRITMPAAQQGQTLLFDLHGGLHPRVVDGDALLQLQSTGDAGVTVRLALHLPASKRTVTLAYGGRIVHSPQGSRFSGRVDTPGLIGAEGVYLDGNSYWYPSFDDAMLTFDLTVETPASWSTMSQGRGDSGTDGKSHWRTEHPQDQIFLVAAAFHRYARATPHGQALVLLRSRDPALAERYLQATAAYLDLYSRLIGPYPYSKFALVENFLPTGFGMPSFTLLGSQVLRLPFIIDSSYPHEILHNWWGNSVYVDDRQGNWSEGLTTYLADQWMAERRGRGAEYRRDALQRYADFVARSQDFPLADFHAREGEVTQAVGYSKGLMVFNMLRRRLGDRAFVLALRRFYAGYRFQFASFPDLIQAFQSTGGQRLDWFFQQWVEQAGAPGLAVHSLQVKAEASGYLLSGVLQQTQAGAAYRLRVPVAVQLENRATAMESTIAFSDKQTQFSLRLPARPLRFAVDPRFDLFRRLDRAEIPASVGGLLGAQRILFVLPAQAPAELRQGYDALARQWAGKHDTIAWDRDVKALPDDRAVLLLGWENRFRSRMAELLQGKAELHASGAQVRGQSLARGRDSVVLTARAGDGPTIAFLAAGQSRALPGLARKVPHYGKYSYLAFIGTEPQNRLKGEWEITDSPLNRSLAAGAPALALAPRPSLDAALAGPPPPDARD